MLLQSSLREYLSAPLVSDDLPKLRSLLPQRPLNYGVLMRWTLALHGMEAYYADVPRADRIKLLAAWSTGVQNLIKESGSSLIQVLSDAQDCAEPVAVEEQT